MKILSVDCSTNSLAYGISEDGVIQSYGEIYFVGTEVHVRCKDARRKVEDSLHIFGSVDYIVFEEVVKVVNIKTALSMAKVFGTVISVLLEIDGAKLVMVEPMVWQNAIGVKSPAGQARKDLVSSHPELKTKSQINKFIREYRKQKIMDFVEDRCGIKAANDNISDAIAINFFAWDRIKDVKKL